MEIFDKLEKVIKDLEENPKGYSRISVNYLGKDTFWVDVRLADTDTKRLIAMRSITWLGNEYILMSSPAIDNAVILKDIHEFGVMEAITRLIGIDDKKSWGLAIAKTEITHRIYRYISNHFKCPEYIKQGLNDEEVKKYWKYMNGPIEEKDQLIARNPPSYFVCEKLDDGPRIRSTVLVMPCGRINEDNTGTSIYLNIAVSEIPSENDVYLRIWRDNKWVETDFNIITEIAEEKIKAARLNKKRFIEW